MANTTEKQELTPEEIAKQEERNARFAEKDAAFRTEKSAEFAEKMKAKAMVWSQPRKISIHMPVNPVPSANGEVHYFRSSNAMLLMQAAHDMGTTDPRWVERHQLEKYHIIPKKGEKSVSIEGRDASGNRGFAKYFNVSQCQGRLLEAAAEGKPAVYAKIPAAVIYDRKQDELAEMMLRHHTITLDAVQKSPNAFFEGAARAYTSAVMQSKEMYKEMEDRKDFILNFDETQTKYKKDQAFLKRCKTGLELSPDKKDYVLNAAKAMLLDGYKESDVKGLVTRYAPQAVKDRLSGNRKYSEYIIKTIQKDPKFVAEKKEKTAAAR